MEKLRSIDVTEDMVMNMPLSLVSTFKASLLNRLEGFETPLTATPGEGVMPIKLSVFKVHHMEIWLSETKQKILKVFWNATSEIS